MMPLTKLNEIAQHIERCVCDGLLESSLTVEGHPACPCRSTVVPGSRVMWECSPRCSSDENRGPGQLTVHVVRLFPTSQFPLPDTAIGDMCEPHTWAAEVVITVLRCSPALGPNGASPSADALAHAAFVQHVDQLAVLRAVECCVPDRPGKPRRMRTSVMDQRAVGPDGGCVGSETRIVVDIGKAA